MALAIDWLTIDSRDQKKLAEFLVQALDGYKITYDDEEEGEVAIEPDDGRGWRLLFLRVDDERVGRTGCTWIFDPATNKPRSSAYSDSVRARSTSVRVT